jgi:hypothetical protein
LSVLHMNVTKSKIVDKKIGPQILTLKNFYGALKSKNNGADT